MTLEEFIIHPDVIDLHARYDEALRNFLKGREKYVRMGKVMTGNRTVIYVKENRLDDVAREFGRNNAVDYLAGVMGLLRNENYGTSRDISSAK